MLTSKRHLCILAFMLSTISAKQIQQGYTKIFNQVEVDNKPLIVMTNNKPVGAIISMSLLDKLTALENKQKMEAAVKEAIAEYKATKLKTILSSKKLREDLKALENDI